MLLNILPCTGQSPTIKNYPAPALQADSFPAGPPGKPINMYTLLYLKWITNRTYCIAQETQCYVAAWMGGEFEGEWIHVCVRLSHSPVHLKLSQYC